MKIIMKYLPLIGFLFLWCSETARSNGVNKIIGIKYETVPEIPESTRFNYSSSDISPMIAEKKITNYWTRRNKTSTTNMPTTTIDRSNTTIAPITRYQWNAITEGSTLPDNSTTYYSKIARHHWTWRPKTSTTNTPTTINHFNTTIVPITESTTYYSNSTDEPITQHQWNTTYAYWNTTTEGSTLPDNSTTYYSNSTDEPITQHQWNTTYAYWNTTTEGSTLPDNSTTYYSNSTDEPITRHQWNTTYVYWNTTTEGSTLPDNSTTTNSTISRHHWTWRPKTSTTNTPTTIDHSNTTIVPTTESTAYYSNFTSGPFSQHQTNTTILKPTVLRIVINKVLGWITF